MRIIYLLQLLCILSALPSCAPSPPPENAGEPGAVTLSPVDSTATDPIDCTPTGQVLDGNRFAAAQEKMLLAISAEQETRDPELGESHRVLTLYDLRDCQVLFRQVLPVNQSPDFPYYLSEITYNKLNHKVAVRGASSFYLFDLEQRRLSGPHQPEFLSKRHADDASAGNILRLEVWEDYLVGWAAGYGAFAFQVGGREQPAPVLPAAEYSPDELNHHSLFLLPSFDGTDGVQALMPVYDPDEGVLSINPLFDSPRPIQTQLTKTFRNNRFLLLKEQTARGVPGRVAIDLAANRIVALPEEMTGKKDAEIITWLKSKRE